MVGEAWRRAGVTAREAATVGLSIGSRHRQAGRRGPASGEGGGPEVGGPGL